MSKTKNSAAMAKHKAALISAQKKALAKVAWKQSDPTYLLSNNQAELVEGIESARKRQVRHVVFRCSRRWGKSWTLAIYALKMCLQNPNYKVKFVAGSIKQLRHIIQPTFKDVLAQCPKEYRDVLPKWDHTMSQYNFDNGSTIVLGGADNKNIDDLLGQAANLIIIDEAGYIKVLHDAVNRVLGPMLATTKGTMVVASTPPADPTHYFHELCHKAEANDALFHRDIYSCDTGLIDVEHEKKQVGEFTDTWKREYLAEPALDQNLTVFYDFPAVKAEVVQEFKRPPHFEHYSRYIMLDYGFNPDATGVLYAYYDYKLATIFIEDELLDQRMTTDNLAKKLKAKRAELWGDLEVHKAKADCQQNILTDLWDRHQLEFSQHTEKGAGSVLQNANNVNVLLRERRIRIHPRCKQLIAQMGAAQWDKPKKNSQKRDLARTDDFQHFDLISALFYLSRIVDYNYDSVPRYPGFNPLTHAVNPNALRAAPAPEDSASVALHEMFGNLNPLGRS